MENTTTIVIDPFRLSMSVMASTMDMARASAAVSAVTEWGAGRPLTITVDQKAGRYAKGKHYRIALLYDEAVLADLDRVLDGLHKP